MILFINYDHADVEAVGDRKKMVSRPQTALKKWINNVRLHFLKIAPLLIGMLSNE